MKFLCDRCKTRYSIGDDRVRGKILKIRCKNCANVITVREGMTADDLPEANRGRPTTSAPIPSASAPAGSALASAFTAQATKPPPALEEEWYVSIEGDQQGPFSLQEAQGWIAAKPFDAEVHCWSEGFDDWLPVDKVSHFRGLRKRPAPPTAPPPLPRAATASTGRSTGASPALAAAPQPREEEPKPLFAATMASLEKATGVKAPATPPNGIVAKPNGRGSAPVPAIPAGGAKAIAAAFDASEAGTTVDEPGLPRRGSAAEGQRGVVEAPPPPEHTMPVALEDEDDSLDIGEVSRVVKLADLAKMGNAPRNNRATGAATALRQTSGVAAIRASNPNLRATGSVAKLDAAALGLPPGEGGAADEAMPLDPAATAAPVVAQAHRRGLIMLIGVAAVLLIGVAVLVVVMLQHQGDDTGGGLGPSRTIDTSRPEELVLRQLPNQGSGDTLLPKPIQTHRPVQVPHPVGPGSGGEEPEGKGDKIKSDEIEDMARKQSAGTQRCYMRAQRGAEGIEIADLKKLSVTLNIDKTGTVVDVTLNDHQTDTLGQCLVGQIKRWKFRESPGGLYRFVLAFAG